MKLTITGSGGFRILPRPGCDCRACQDAKANDYVRLGPSMYIHDEAILFDTPEDIAVELNTAEIGEVKHIFYTHWHPDHVLGMRVIEQLCTAWAADLSWKMVPKCKITVHMPKDVHDEMMYRYGLFFEFWHHIGIVEIDILESPAEIGNLRIEYVSFETRHRTKTTSTIYIISEGGKRIAYAPCDITPFPKDERFRNCDLMILQLGWLGEEMAIRAAKGPHYEISFDEILDVIEKYKPKKVILTHIGDECGMTLAELKQLEVDYAEHNIQIAYDGMEIEV